MKKHYIQNYNNECGLYAIKNLLSYYNIKDKINLDYSEDGTSFSNMEEVLKKYFFIVESIEVELSEFLKLKEIQPFIILIGKDNVNHFVVVEKRKNNYFLINDSLKKRKYYISYDKLNQFYLKKAIICEQVKKPYLKFDLNLFFLPFLSLIETMFLLSLTIILQQIIDTGFQDGFLYILIELFLILITYFKIKIYLKTYKKYDLNIVCNTLDNIFHLKYDFVNKHYINDIFYNLYDAYNLKNMYLSIFFTVLNDIVLYILASIIIFKYSYILGIIIIIISLVVFIINKLITSKAFTLLEIKRKDELEFISFYKDSFNHKDRIYLKHESYLYKESLKRLKKYQLSSYNHEKFESLKNLLLLVFQGVINCLVIIIYFMFLKDKMSIGKLAATLNLTMLILQPILNIASQLTNYANFKLQKRRVLQLKDNIE